MPEEPWNKHTPGDPMPRKCRDSVVEVRFRNGGMITEPAGYRYLGRIEQYPGAEITDWRFVERKGEDVIAAPYDALEWDEDNTSTVVLKKPGQPEWVRDDDLVRFSTAHDFEQAADFGRAWEWAIAFQIKRRPVLTPAVPQVLALLAVATDDEADAIRSAARRANIEVPE